MKKTFALLLVPAVLLALAAMPLFAQDEAEPATEPTSEPTSQPSDESAEASPEHAAMMAMCPMHVEGTQITLEGTANGAAMAFINAAQADELRQRIHQLAEFHNANHAAGVEGGMPAAEASFQDTEFGAILALAAADASQVDTLRQYLGAHAAELAEGRCPMMIMWGGHGEGGAPATE